MIRQGLARRLSGEFPRHALDGRLRCGVGLELLKTQLQLLDLRIQLFAGVTELHPLEPRELQLQLLDQHIA